MSALEILLIEDDTIEILKLQRTISSLKLNHKIIKAENGEIALNILKQKKEIPDIILLDLNMPKMNGIEFLSILKGSDSLRHIPTIILSTSSNSNDLKQCYKLGIAGYILKPLKYDDYVIRIKKLLDYWTINELIQN